MYRTEILPAPVQMLNPGLSEARNVNERGPIDTFITRDPTPKSISRRAWRRRREQRGKS